MGRRKQLTPEQVEVHRDEFNKLVIEEERLLKEYPKVNYLYKSMMAKKLRNIALKLALLENILDQHK